MKVSASNLDSKIPGVKTQVRRQGVSSLNSAPSFGGKTRANMELARNLVNCTPRFPRFLQWLGKNDGEILNTIVTGIGTAFVAPVFIAFNPFSKEDKETRTYSAWRQPISAIIAAVMQIGINMKYNAHLEKIASTGHFERADLSAFPTYGYLTKAVKHEKPELSKKDLEIEIERRQFDARWQAINDARRTMKDRVFTYEELIDDEVRDVAKDEVKKEFKSEIDAIKGKKKQDKFIETKVNERAARVAERVINEKADIKWNVRDWVHKAKSRQMSYDNLIAAKQAEFDALRTAGTASSSEISLFEKTLTKLRSYGSFDTIKDIGDTKAKVLQNVKIKQYVYAKIDNGYKVLKNYKRWTGIFISLATLPISCGLLNYAYPRIMEKIMPDASKKKKEKQEAELKEYAAAQQRKEVK